MRETALGSNSRRFLQEGGRRTENRSNAAGETKREFFGKSGLEDLFLHGSDVVLYAPVFDRPAIRIIETIGSASITITRLTDGSRVDQVTPIRIDG